MVSNDLPLTYVVEWPYHSREFDNVEEAYALLAEKMYAIDQHPYTREMAQHLKSVVLWIREMPFVGGLRAPEIPCIQIDASGTVTIDAAKLRRAFEEWRDGIDVRGRAQAERERERYPDLASGFLMQRYPPKSSRAKPRRCTCRRR